jgi:hypothetical protein
MSDTTAHCFGTPALPRFAFSLVVLGLLAVLLTVVLVMADVTLPGGLRPFAVALLAGAGGISLVAGLWLLDGPGVERAGANRL